MARQNATNFTGPLQFPYATAAADLFKKEDVQTLALAVDQHDHSAGKGLVVAPLPNSVPTSALQDGSVTSVKIADGTILNADLSDNSVTSAKIADRTILNTDLASSAQVRQIGIKYAANVTFSSTTAGAFVATPVVVNGLVELSAQTVVATYNIPITNSLAGQIMLLGLGLDGTAPSTIGSWTSPVANAIGTLSGAYLYDVNFMPAGAHVFRIYLWSQGGTMGVYAASAAYLWLSEWNDG